MTNEELVALIQAGERDKLQQLWEQVEGLVKWKANKVILAAKALACVEFEDLYNSGYIALVKAADSYKAASGAFSTWFMFHLQTAFAEATGYRTDKQRSDLLNKAYSLDVPASGVEGDTPLVDYVADEADDITEVENKIYNVQLRAALDSVIDELQDERHQKVIRWRYFEGKTLQEVGNELDCNINGARQLEVKALNKMRARRRKLEPFIEHRIDLMTDFYRRGSVRQQSSPVESLVIYRELLRGKR